MASLEGYSEIYHRLFRRRFVGFQHFLFPLGRICGKMDPIICSTEKCHGNELLEIIVFMPHDKFFLCN